MITEHSIIAEG